MLLQLTIDDTSPTLSFSPFKDTLSTPNLSAGWNPYCATFGFASAPGQLGSGLSYHITSKDGASLSLTWHGNGIQLFGNATLSSYSVNLDGSDLPLNGTTPVSPSKPDGVLVEIEGLKDGKHTITLTAQIPQTQTPRNSSMLVFDKAIIRTGLGNVAINETLEPQRIDNSTIAFLGRWSFEVSQMSFHISNTSGDKVSTSFNGTAFLLLGRTGPDAGNYSVTLDGVTTTLSAQSSFIVPNTTLFFATGLNESVEHLVDVKNDGGKLSILEDGFEAFVTLQAPPSSVPANKAQNPSYSSGTIAAFGLAGVLFFVLVISGIYFFVWRPRRRRQSSLTGSFDKKFRFPNNLGTGGISSESKRAVDDIDIVGTKEIRADDTCTSGFARWQREAVEGSAHGIALPILFKHSYSEEAISAREGSPEAKHPYVRYSYDASRWTEDRSVDTDKNHSPSEMNDRDRMSVALANLKNKGKARQITGTDSIAEKTPCRTGSPIPNLLQGLHVKISSSSKKWPKLRTPRDSLSLSLNAPPSPVPGTSRWQSDPDQVSPFFAAENPSPVSRVKGQPPLYPATTTPSPLPSVPCSVSDSNSNPVNHKSSSSPHQRESRLLLPEEDDIIERHSYDSEPVEYPLPPPPHAHIRRNQSNVSADQDQSFVDVLSSQVVRSLSPRTCERGGSGGIRASRLGVSFLSSEGDQKEDTSNEQTASAESDHDAPSSMRFARNVSPSLVPMPPKKALPDETPPEELAGQQTDDVPPGGLTVPKKSGSPVLPSLKRTSPFDLKFDWQSVRISAPADAPPTSRRTSRSKGSKSPMQKPSQNDMLRVPLGDQVQSNSGASRSRLRLTTSTLSNPPNRPLSHQSQMSSDVVTSFIDFTSSSEGSVRAKSLRTTQSEEKTFGNPANQPPPFDLVGLRSQEPISRWSDTTNPSISTRPRGSPRELPSREASSSSAEKSSSPGESHANPKPTQRQSGITTATQFSSENPVHVHPSIVVDLESQAESLPRRFSDTFIRSDSEEASGSGSSSRRTTDSSNAFHTRLLLASRYPPLPEGTEDVASTGS